MDATAAYSSTPTFEQITTEQWSRLASAKIFFAHQSVGGNLLEGVQDVLRERADIPLRVMEISDPSEMTAPGLYHANVGKNGEPATKLQAFAHMVEGAGDSDVALLKYCYADFRHGTDATQLFDEYRRKVEQIRAQRPDLAIVHVTVPLVTDAGTLRHIAAVVRRKPPAREVNLIRHQFNELLRATYAGKEPLFDLARLEATDAAGNAVRVRYKGQSVPVLAAAWTFDGGHLNEVARRRMAQAFLASLATVYDEAS
jgi:hypothetical protein